VYPIDFSNRASGMFHSFNTPEAVCCSAAQSLTAKCAKPAEGAPAVRGATGEEFIMKKLCGVPVAASDTALSCFARIAHFAVNRP
jgi:hypothetical protein